MRFEKWDDHYNQEPYRYETNRGCTLNTIKPGQRWNYPFLFHMIAAPSFWYNTQPGHKDFWFIEGGWR